MKKVVVIKCGDHLVQQWVDNMTPLIPEFEVVGYRDKFDKSRVAYVIGWCPDARWVNEFKNIQALVSIGSGVDHILNLDDLSPSIPVIRTVSDDLVQRMREFTVLCVLAWHRQLPLMLENAKRAEWHRYAVGTADTIRVGIMGFGGMGQSAAAALQNIGYKVSAWAKSPRTDTSLDYFYGQEQLSNFVKQTNVLVCMLPLTKDTENILDYDLLNGIQKGGCLINLGRGGHLVDADLLRVLNEGHLSAAFLDVFRTEPLPQDSPFWKTPNVFVTSHSAAYISPDSGPKIIAENIRRHESGLPVSPLYNREVGY